VIVVPGVDRLAPEHGRLFITLGVFDGIHRGHAYLLEHLARAAAAHDAVPAVITFDHHPDEVITGTAPPLLCDPEERLERLAAAGVGLTVVHHFDEPTRRTPYDAFVRRIAERVDLAGFLMTPESSFGFERRGTPAAVAALGRALGYSVVVVPTLELGGRPIRSTDIRDAIRRGDLRAAADLLGRPYAVVGDVEDPPSGVASVGDPAGAIDLRFAMPVALPPPAAYPVRVTPIRAESQPGAAAFAVVDATGRVSLAGLRPVTRCDRLRAEFG